MKIFDKLTRNEIEPKSRSRKSGTDRVIECFLKGRGAAITNIIFGTVSRGYVDGKLLPSGITFDNCVFNYVSFGDISECTFKNCHFNKCNIHSMRDVTMENCSGCDSEVSCSYGVSMLSGTCSFSNCYGIRFYGSIDPDAVIKSVNFPDFDKLVARLEQERIEIEEAKRKNKELRKFVKYGYKVVNAPVLVKLSFPDEAEIVNLDKDKSRASKAFVESVHVINDFGAEGVSNYAYSPSCNYVVGQEVYPDSFNSNPNVDCGHGIHFCKDIEKLSEYGSVNNNQIKSIKKMLNL